MPDRDYPKEYAILVTDQRSIFIRQPKSRGSWVLRQEIRFGTALVTDVTPKGLEDYKNTSLEALVLDRENLTVPHAHVISMGLRADQPERRNRDFFVYWVMKRRKEIFQVYNFEMKYGQDDADEQVIRFYAVPLGIYFKPRRQTQTRELILREYATSILDTFRAVLPASVLSSATQTGSSPNPTEYVAWAKRLS